jgi:hypothetical protein
MTTDRLQVGVWGLGNAGRQMVDALREHRAYELAAAITTSADKAGRDVGTLLSGDPIGVDTTLDEAAVLADDSIDVILHAGLGSNDEVAALLGRVADAGKTGITVSGFIHPVSAIGAAGAAALDARAKDAGAHLLGTGVNPGYLLDALPAAIASLSCPTRVRAQRINDMRFWGDGALREEGGAGLDPGEVVVSDHLSLVSSVAVLADALGGATTAIEEHHEILVSESDRSDGRRTVAAGQTKGFRRTARVMAGEIAVEVEWTAIFCLDPALDDGLEMAAKVSVEGSAQIECSITGYGIVDSYPATAARAIAAIAPLRSLPPGLYRPDQVAAAPC